MGWGSEGQPGRERGRGGSLPADLPPFSRAGSCHGRFAAWTFISAQTQQKEQNPHLIYIPYAERRAQLKALHSMAEKCLHNHLFLCHKETKEPDCVCKSAAHNLPAPAFILHYATIMCNHMHSHNNLLQLFCPETVDTD